MPDRSRDVRALLRTPLGRLQLLDGALERVWPFFRVLARVYRRTAARSTRVVAVAGSFGKSTTARAVVAALGVTPHPRMVFNNRTWVPLAVLRIRPGHRYAVIETGITVAGQMARHAYTVRPDIAVVTSVGSEHNRHLGSLEEIRAEKVKMVRALPESGWAVLNGDDPHVRWMSEHTRARLLTFGFDERNDVRASEPVLDWPKGTRFTLHTPAGVRRVGIRLIGRPMIYPVLAAVAVALSQGMSLDQVLPALESLDPTPGRLQPVALPNGAMLLRDDFKAPLETIEAALDVLGEIPARRRIVVLGDVAEPMGSVHAIYRQVGERVAQVATRAIFVAGKKEFRAYAAGATRGGLTCGEVIHAGRSVSRAVALLRADLGPGDVVLVKGRVNQRLERIVLALLGRTVRCDLKECAAKLTACNTCPMLEQGWEGRRVVV